MSDYSELLARLDAGYTSIDKQDAAAAIQALLGDKEHLKALWKVAEARVAEEREACAKIAANTDWLRHEERTDYSVGAHTAHEIIEARIRARGGSNEAA